MVKLVNFVLPMYGKGYKVAGEKNGMFGKTNPGASEANSKAVIVFKNGKFISEYSSITYWEKAMGSKSRGERMPRNY